MLLAHSVQIGQACMTLHVDVLNSICQKSNNDKITSPVFENIQLQSPKTDVS